MDKFVPRMITLTLFFAVFGLGTIWATQPVIIQNIGDRLIPTNAYPLPISLPQYIRADPATNLVRVTTSLIGSNGIPLGFTLQLFPSNAPLTVANFLNYVNDGAYEHMLIHRSVPGFVIQTGGYDYQGNTIPAWTNIVPCEYGLSNIRGTVAMSLSGLDSNSATDQWFINLNNNSSTLDATNNANIPTYGTNGNITFSRNPPFTVFAKVLGNGMQVVDFIAKLPTINLGSPFETLPILSSNTPIPPPLSNLVEVSRVATIPYFALSSDSTAYSPHISNSTLYIDYIGGTNLPSNPVSISVFVSDTNGLSTNTSFLVWHLTNQTRSINYPTNSNQYYSPNGFDMAFYPYSSDGTAIPAANISWVGPAVFTGYTNGFNHFAFNGTGTVTFTYVQPGNLFYKPATNTSQFIVSPAPQTITFPQIANQTYSSNPFVLLNPPYSSSGIPVNISIKQGSPMTVIGNKFFMTGVGTVTLIASNSTNVSVYQPATPVTNSFTITPSPQTITFAPISNKVLPIAPFALSGKASSGLPIRYSLISNSPAILTNGTNLRITSPGTITIVASQAGTNVYLAANSVTNSFRAASNQTISAFKTIPNRTYSPSLSTILIKPIPTAKSGLPVTITVKSGPATIGSNNTLFITGAGSVVLAANQVGNTNYFPAPEVTTSFIVKKAPQTISAFLGIPSKLTNGIAPFSITIPSTSSGLTNTTLQVTGAGTLSPPNIITLRDAGIPLTITATNAGNSNYLVASLTTNIPVFKGIQSITFPGTDVECEVGKTYTLNATSSSGLPIAYKLIPAINLYASVSGSNLTINSYTTNRIAIVATQAGNSGYNAASSVTNSFSVIANQGGGTSGGSISLGGGNPNPAPTPGGSGWIIK